MKTNIFIDGRDFFISEDGKSLKSFAPTFEEQEMLEPSKIVDTKYKIGARAILCMTRDISKENPVEKYFLYFDLEGVPGNSNPDIKKKTGWRGTTNNISIHAEGEVEIVAFKSIQRKHSLDEIRVTVKSIGEQ